MKKFAILSIASAMILACSTSCNNTNSNADNFIETRALDVMPQANNVDSSNTEDIDKTLSELQAKTKKTKYEIHESFPELGSARNIDLNAAERLCQTLGDGSQMEMNQSAYLDYMITKIKVYDKYINCIKEASSDSEKGKIANEFAELSPLMENIAIYATNSAALSCYGGSMMSMMFNSAGQMVYNRWLQNVNKPSGRLTVDEANLMLKKAGKKWSTQLQNMQEDGFYDSSINENDKAVKNALRKLRNLTKNEPPYRWAFELLNRNYDE